MDIFEIVNAWVTSMNPTDDVKNLAYKRLDICNSCEYNVEIFKHKQWSRVCSDCGCPLSKKIFSNKTKDACGLNKWEKVDNDFNSKKNKLI